MMLALVGCCCWNPSRLSWTEISSSPSSEEAETVWPIFLLLLLPKLGPDLFSLEAFFRFISFLRLIFGEFLLLINF